MFYFGLWFCIMELQNIFLLTPSGGEIVFDNCLNIKCWPVLRVHLPREPLLQLFSWGVFCLCIWIQLCNVTHYVGYIIGCYRHIIPYIQYSVRVFMCFISLLWLMSKYVILCCGNKCNITNFNLLWLIYVKGIFIRHIIWSGLRWFVT